MSSERSAKLTTTADGAGILTATDTAYQGEKEEEQQQQPQVIDNGAPPPGESIQPSGGGSDPGSGDNEADPTGYQMKGDDNDESQHDDFAEDNQDKIKVLTDDGKDGVDEDKEDGEDGGEDDEDAENDNEGEDAGEAGTPSKGNKTRVKKGTAKSGITRIRYSNDFKIKILDQLDVENVTVAEMARRHNLPEATLRDWVKTKFKITTAQVNRRGSAKSNSRDNLQKVTDALRTFMDLNDRLGACGMSKLPITNAMIAKQGQEVKSLLLEKDAKKPFLTPQERKTLNNFNASIWWSKKWARKHNLHSVGHREAAKAAAALSSTVPEIRKQYSTNHVFFVLDTMLFYKVLPAQSYVLQTSNPGTGTPAQQRYLGLLRDRVSLFICANSSGTHKIPLTMISDTKDPPSFVADRQKVFPYMYQDKAWADPKSLLQWWKDIFLPDIRAWTDEKVLLVLQKPSIVDLDDPQEQVTVKFLPPLLAYNHSTENGMSVSSFFEPPINMLSVVKTKYRYSLLKEVMDVYEERNTRREVAAKANLETPGLKQGELPHLQDCMRILNKVWDELPASMISSSSEEERGPGKKKKRRRRRKKKGDDDDTIAIENDAIAYTDEMGTDELIKDIVQFFRKNAADISSDPSAMEEDSLDKSVAEVQRCFLNSNMLLKANQFQVRTVLGKWIGLEDNYEIRSMLQSEILARMKFRLIIGVDDVDQEDDNNGNEGGTANAMNGIKKAINEDVAVDCATQLLQCAVRLSKEHPAFHSLASQLMEASDSAFVALREAKNPSPPKIEPTVPKKRKQRVCTGPRKKRPKQGNEADEGRNHSEKQPEEKIEEPEETSEEMPPDDALADDRNPELDGEGAASGNQPSGEYGDGEVVEI